VTDIRKGLAAFSRILLFEQRLWIGLFLTVISTVLFFVPQTSAIQTVPYKMNYQGRLTNARGTALADGLYNMKFRIYDTASGGTLQWSEVREVGSRVQVTNGQFAVQLGDVTALPAGIFTNQNLYFEVELPSPASATCSTSSCASYTEGPMTPRGKIASSAYAVNADQIDGIDGSSLARNDAANAFSADNSFDGTVTVGAANSATKFVVKDNSNAALLTADTSSTIVKIGTSGSATLANVRLLTTDAEFNGTVRIGSAANGVDISGVNGILLSGTARRVNSIQLMPEYANAVLDAGSGGSNTGSMTSKLDLSTRRNYYKWTTTQATPQSYDVVVQVPIPSDFSAWANTTPITIDTYTSNITTGTITIQAIDTAGTIVGGMNFSSITPTAATAWQSRSPGTISGTFTPGGSMLLRIRMASPTNGDIRLSTIKMDYLTKW
jgi:hypothetical protein